MPRRQPSSHDATMRRFIVVTVVGIAVAVLIGPKGPLGGFWAPSPETPRASGSVLAGLVAERMVESLVFGVGVATLLLGRRLFVARTATLDRATIAWLASVWLLASWMPHGALHLHVGAHPSALLPIEWIFHVGAIAAVVTLLWAFLTGTRVVNPQPQVARRDRADSPR